MCRVAGTPARWCITLAALVGPVGCGPDDDPYLDEEDARADLIVGGAPVSGLPAVGALFVDGAPYCTGTLVGPRKVLTAAHCVDGVRASRMEFRIGPNAQAPRGVHEASRLTAHPDFDPYLITNDIAVVTLTTQPHVEPLRLVERMDASWIGKKLLFVGYGVTRTQPERGAGRKRAAVMAVGELDETRFSYFSQSKNTCHGDSGGPALVREASGAYRVAGVTSWGDAECARFGVDTRVDAFLDFVGE